MIKISANDDLLIKYPLPFNAEPTSEPNIDISSASINVGKVRKYSLGRDGIYVTYENGWFLELKKKECDGIPEGRYTVKIEAHDSFGNLVVEDSIDIFIYSGHNEEISKEMDSVTPLDLLSSKNYTNREERDIRYDICKKCPELIKMTKTCKKCGCFMSMKTWLKDASCPINKW